MSSNDGAGERPLSRAEINELSAELRHARKDLTDQLTKAMELSNLLTDIVVRLLRAVG